MNLSKIFFNELNRDSWCDYLKKIDGATYLNSYDVIEYYSGLNENIVNQSFILKDDRKNILAVMSLAISKNLKELSFNGTPNSTLSITNNISESDRRKILKYVFEYIKELMNTHQLTLIRMLTHPINIKSINNKSIISENSFETLLFDNVIYRVDNTFIINLLEDKENLLKNVNKYRRQSFRKSQKKGLHIQVVDKSSFLDVIDAGMENMRQAHFLSAGRETRPRVTWEIMKKTLLNGNATLFIAKNKENKEVSYLFCGEFQKTAFGWSQVNIEKYEKELSPRHLLEWEAILFYKDKGFNFYEIGEKFYNQNFYYKATNKEISIGDFKEKYGAKLYPKIHWIGFNSEEEKNKFLKKELL
jgi:hypothetical protein